MGKITDYTFADLIRKTGFILYLKINLIPIFFRKCSFCFYTRCWPKYLGKRVIILRVANKMTMGRGAAVYSNVILEIGENAVFTVGKNFTISYGSIIVCNKTIQFGDHVMIGEYTSIRDTSHSYQNNGIPFSQQADQSLSISIGNNVWIGRGCIIMPGTVIADNVIIGANSVVKGQLETNSVYVGSPAVKIRTI